MFPRKHASPLSFTDKPSTKLQRGSKKGVKGKGQRISNRRSRSIASIRERAYRVRSCDRPALCVVAGARISIQGPDRIFLGFGQLHPPGGEGIERNRVCLLGLTLGALRCSCIRFACTVNPPLLRLLFISLFLSGHTSSFPVTDPPTPFCVPFFSFFSVFFLFFFYLFAEDLIYALRYSFAPRAGRPCTLSRPFTPAAKR